METQSSILTIEQDKKITLSLVDGVDAFSEERITLTVAGKRVVIEGANLKILSFSEGSKNFTASGQVHLVKFGAAKGRISSLLK